MTERRITRRRVFQQLAGATVAASSIYCPHVFAATPKKKLGVALVGLGYYSRDLLAPALQLTQHCELKGIVTGTPAKIPVWQEKYGLESKNIYNYENMHQVANNPDIDVLYIVVPTALHKKYSVIAANAGKHVWCEKPMAMTKTECSEIIAVCAKNKVQLTVGYRLHHEPNTQTVMSYAKTRPFGAMKVITAEAGYAGDAPSADDWRLKRNMGGGALYDMGVYAINAGRYATGMDPFAVSAVHEVLRPDVFKEVDESTYFTMFFPGGIKAECATSVGKNLNRLKVSCDTGWYELSPMQSYNGVRGSASDGRLFNKVIVNQQALQMDSDAQAVMRKASPLVPGEEGLKDIVVIEAALKSASNNGKRELV